MDPNEPFELHFILFNINGGDPYKDGYCGFYHGKLILPETYPFKPPKIIMITPSGRFQTNTPISTSFSNFDPDSWNPALGIYNTLECLIEFMETDEIAYGGMVGTKIQRKQLALNSISFNLDEHKNPVFTQIFDR